MQQYSDYELTMKMKNFLDRKYAEQFDSVVSFDDLSGADLADEPTSLKKILMTSLVSPMDMDDLLIDEPRYFDTAQTAR